jgi:hypothetical protein
MLNLVDIAKYMGCHILAQNVLLSNDKYMEPLFHRLNIELDLQSLLGVLCTAVLIG